jgi:hypothetical protein
VAQGWTIETVKEYFEKLLIEKDKYWHGILTEKDKAINIALAAAKEAVGVAEKNAEKWRDQANEWRNAMNDKDRLLMQRSEFILYKESMEKRFSEEKERSDKGEGRGSGMDKMWAGILVIASALVGAAISYLLK